MTSNRLVFLTLSLTLMVAILFGSLTVAAGSDDDEGSLYKYLSVFTEVVNLVRQSYVEPTPTDNLFAGALDGTVDALDPFSTYVPASEVEAYLATLAVGDAHSGLTLAKDRGIVYVAAAAAASPAERLEIEPGDIVARIDGRSTRETPLWELQNMLARDPGTELPVEILRRGEPQEMTLVLERFVAPQPQLESVEGAAVIRVADIGPETPAAVGAILEQLVEEGQERLLLDLRGVADGDYDRAYDTAGLFVSGHLGELRNRQGALKSFESEDEPVWTGHLVVLVDRSSLGAVELIADVLRSGAGAEIVGQPTFGFAGRLGLVELTDGSRIRLTDGFYSGPANETLEDGLEPDLLVSGAERSFDEQEVPLDELTMRRGLERLLELGAEVEREAA